MRKFFIGALNHDIRFPIPHRPFHKARSAPRWHAPHGGEASDFQPAWIAANRQIEVEDPAVYSLPINAEWIEGPRSQTIPLGNDPNTRQQFIGDLDGSFTDFKKRIAIPENRQIGFAIIVAAKNGKVGTSWRIAQTGEIHFTVKAFAIDQ